MFYMNSTCMSSMSNSFCSSSTQPNMYKTCVIKIVSCFYKDILEGGAMFIYRNDYSKVVSILNIKVNKSFWYGFDKKFIIRM